MGLIKWFRRVTKRLSVKFYKWESGSSFIKTYDESSGYEQICTAIIRKMINHSDTKFTIAPLSGKRYLINKVLDIFIIIEDNKVEITNHVYHYVIKLSKRDTEKITKQFDKKVDDIRTQYENEIKSQITNTLHKIYEKITNEEFVTKRDTKG
jgi:hypothetical protein